MKHKVLIGAIIASLFAFLLYTTNAKRVQNAQLKIVEPKVSKSIKSKKKTKEPSTPKKTKEPKVSSIEYSNHVTAKKGSNKKLVKTIKSIMGLDDSYQVAVQDLNNSSRYAIVSNTNKAHDATGSMRLFLLIALYEQEQRNKINSKTAIKIKKSDKARKENMFQVNISYGIAYLREAMLKGNKTAANALISKIGVRRINAIAKKMGAKQTRIAEKVNDDSYGKTTAMDLTKTMIGLYQGRVLNRQYASKVLSTISKNETQPALVKGITGGVYAIGDDNSAVAIVQGKGNAYCMSVWSSNSKNFNKLGKSVNNWFSKKK